jgi:hypothetical protein
VAVSVAQTPKPTNVEQSSVTPGNLSSAYEDILVSIEAST